MPDGLIYGLYGTVEGTRRDFTVLQHSGREKLLSEMFVNDGRKLYVFDDSAYLLRPYMKRSFVTGFAAPEQIVFNAEMASPRPLEEHNFHDFKQIWKTQDFMRQLEVRLAPIGLFYKSCAILLNFRTCL